MCESIRGRIFEVIPEGDKVWAYINPFTERQEATGPPVGDVRFMFCLYRYASDGPDI